MAEQRTHARRRQRRPRGARRPGGASALRARALGVLFVAGATIGLVSLLLPHARHADMPGLWSNVGLAFAGGGALLSFPRRVRGWMVHGALLIGTLLITRAILLSGEPVSFYSVWFVWVALYAFYFFERRTGIAYTALAGGLYAITLVNDPPTSPVARWLTTFATLIVAGGFIDALVSRSRRDAANAAATAERMASVADMALELAGLSDPIEARRALRRAAAKLTGARQVVLWEPNPAGREIVAAASDGAALLVRALSGNRDVGAVEAYVSARPVWSSGEPLAARAPEFESPGPVCLWQPIGEPPRVAGVLALLWDDAAVLHDESLRAVCELVAAQARVMLERLTLLAQLERVARTDELTALPNRRAWDEALPREMHRAVRSGEPLCVALLDLDHFKRYNDTFGHQTGDLLLSEVAHRWMRELRAEDILARYGGEEFAIALPACSVHHALEVMQRLNEVLPAGQSCSAGVAQWNGAESAGEVLERADQALYEAKRNGRNQAVVAPGPELAPA